MRFFRNITFNLSLDYPSSETRLFGGRLKSVRYSKAKIRGVLFEELRHNDNEKRTLITLKDNSGSAFIGKGAGYGVAILKGLKVDDFVSFEGAEEVNESDIVCVEKVPVRVIELLYHLRLIQKIPLINQYLVRHLKHAVIFRMPKAVEDVFAGDVALSILKSKKTGRVKNKLWWVADFESVNGYSDEAEVLNVYFEGNNVSALTVSPYLGLDIFRLIDCEIVRREAIMEEEVSVVFEDADSYIWAKRFERHSGAVAVVDYEEKKTVLIDISDPYSAASVVGNINSRFYCNPIKSALCLPSIPLPKGILARVEGVEPFSLIPLPYH